ncbi:response regulator [Aquipuribacter nitratireducens]|uniref:Response regulator n=1 Tax=Aquipuribacter nitratireducens TaxID=650104 RepID=A0ABW0GKV1_9MICO
MSAAPAQQEEPVVVLAVDDQLPNLRLLDAVLTPRGYEVLCAPSGRDCLALLAHREVDVVLLDVLMPGMDGYETCRRLRADERTAFLPVVMLTASGQQQRVEALRAGADDFVTKPFDTHELLARIASLARVRRYHVTVARQAEELARQAEELACWNRELEGRVRTQVAELQRLHRLRRFLAPQVAELVLEAGDEVLASHRREIVVVFCDLRGFTPFAEANEPEEVMAVLASYHRALGELVHAHGGTLERFTGDGIMVFFGDPVEQDDAAARALAMALAMRERVRVLAAEWARRGHDLALGVGIAQGYATLGQVGFEGRQDYAAIGSVTNLAARLCGEAAAWQVLVSQRVTADVDGLARFDQVDDVVLKGFRQPVRVFEVVEVSG